MYMISIFNMVLDVFIVFVVGAATGAFLSWRSTRRHYRRKLASIKPAHTIIMK